jgi:replication factor A1
MNLADATDNTWATAFQETAEKILETKSDDLGRMSEHEEEQYSAVFQKANFKTFNFRMRAKADTYNDETRVKHTVVDATEIEWTQYVKKMMAEIETLGGSIPDQVIQLIDVYEY